MKHATFRQLQAFEAVARTGSYTAAAEDMHIAQPTLSMQIKKLTERVGAPLLEQVGRKVFLTEAGRELLRTSREIFSSLQRFEMLIDEMHGVRRGTLSLCGVTTSEYFIPRLLGIFSKRYPGIRASLAVINRESVLRRLQDNQDDMYILSQPPSELDIEAKPILDNPIVVVAPRDHALAKQKKVTLSALARESFLMREAGSGTRMVAERLMREHAVKFHVSMELGSNEAIKQAAMNGLGISMLSYYAVQDEVRRKELSLVPVVGFPIVAKWYVVYPNGKQLSVAARTFHDFLLNEGQKVLKTHKPAM